MIAETSASKWPRLRTFIACRCANEDARILPAALNGSCIQSKRGDSVPIFAGSMPSEVLARLFEPNSSILVH